MTTRRAFLRGLLAMPAVVHAGNLMSVRRVPQSKVLVAVPGIQDSIDMVYMVNPCRELLENHERAMREFGEAIGADVRRRIAHAPNFRYIVRKADWHPGEHEQSQSRFLRERIGGTPPLELSSREAQPEVPILQPPSRPAGQHLLLGRGRPAPGAARGEPRTDPQPGDPARVEEAQQPMVAASPHPEPVGVRDEQRQARCHNAEDANLPVEQGAGARRT